ncbi:OLC1v1037027C1 [Oldenlandia corymbosa var. corymbosa]|uniref:OLC1v1037027C1 n=1 Tax=Oldenlandia corymbosa var. corymbosa TaxID=529605 RepID=A0AAV1CZY9_OLDCO|nr:OLC1v1037027C1 [Oldenlandia corymbosa var. corymbosa]
MACSGGALLTGITSPLFSSYSDSSSSRRRKLKVHNRPNSGTIFVSTVCCSCSVSTSSSTAADDPESPLPPPQKFRYSRAIPSLRWPHLNFTDTHQSPFTVASPNSSKPVIDDIHDVDVDDENEQTSDGYDTEGGGGKESIMNNDCDQVEEMWGGRDGNSSGNRTKVKKMNKLALKRAKDWRKRVDFLTNKILGLNPEEHVADVLDEKLVQMTPTDFCFVVKWVGQSSWQRALEVYEWLNLRHWYSPNPRMLATVLGVLGKANQEALAVEIFSRAEPQVGNTVQVYNAMMGVYARNGRFSKVQQLLDLMRERGCEPDLVSFNTLINARLKSGPMTPNLSIELLNQVRRSGIRPDIITYNTIISACSREANMEEAVKVFDDMQTHKCQPDLWTYNAMISVYGRCGLPGDAERLFQDLGSKGFFPDAVTYNSLLYAFARDGNVAKVGKICDEMLKMGFGKDEMTFNTIIHMYGKSGQDDLALQLYRDMKTSGRNPDVVTYTVLIDSLGKANKIAEAEKVMSEMLDAGVKPTVRTYSALICGYAKAGKKMEAEEMFNSMRRSGIRPDQLAYSVMLDIHLRSNDIKKSFILYQEMVDDGFRPDLFLYEVMLRFLGKENKAESIWKVVRDLEIFHQLNPQAVSSLLTKGECYSFAAEMLRKAVVQGYTLDKDNLLSILSSYSSSGRHLEAIDLLNFLKEHSSGYSKFISEALVVIFCKAHQLDAALLEYYKLREYSFFTRSFTMFDSLIKCCEESEHFDEASQIFSDMRFNALEPSWDIYRIMTIIYCRLGFPETAQCLVHEAESRGIAVQDISIYVCLIEAFGKLKLLDRAAIVVGTLRRHYGTVDRKAWNALMQAYAASGCYENARAAFNTMMRDGPSPTVETINSLLEALIVDNRLSELYVVIEELQDMGFKISKSSTMLMLEAFVQAGNTFEVKKIYQGMKAAGYFPTMHLYRVTIGLLSRAGKVRDVEAMVFEMQQAGFKPDLFIWNSMLKMYTRTEDYKRAVQVYQQISEAGLEPDQDTYNTLILMYCRDCRPEEGLNLMHQMTQKGLEPRLDTYKSLIAAFCKLLMLEQAEELFERLRSSGQKLDRSFYHLMMKMYRSSQNHAKAEKLTVTMKESGVEPSIATMHLLMTSYGTSGQPIAAEKVLNDLKISGITLGTLPYISVIDAYLKNGDYSVAIQKLSEMRAEGLEPDHMIWTCFIRAASRCHSLSEALTLLTAVGDTGFDLPIRLLNSTSESLVQEMDHCLVNLKLLEDNIAFNFVNALEDLLWAFELRATASWIFQLAIKRNIYRHDIFRVAEKDWGADFRKLSAGAALVGLTLWLDHMQDASLEGIPESPKSVVLITGASEYNQVSLNSSLKAYLWEMGSPFLPCETRSGLLVAKSHSLRLWLKDSPFCEDLELKDSLKLPETNSMQLVGGCYIRRGLVPAFRDINEKLVGVRPKKFARLALLPDEKRDGAIQAEIEGRKEKLAKLRKRTGLVQKKGLRVRRKKFVRRATPLDSSKEFR